MKPLLKSLHKWLGLGLCLFLALQALTGLMMAHHEALTVLLHPEARIEVAPAAPLDDLLEAIAGAEPAGKLDRIAYSPEPDIAPTVLWRMPDRSLRVGLVDPGTATVLSSGSLWQYPEQAADRLHTSLLLGLPGHVMLMIEGLGLAFMAVTGVVVWWPKARRFKEALTIHWTAPWRRLLRDLHLSPGVFAAAFLTVSGLTGAMMVADPFVAAAVGAVAPMAPPLDPRVPPTEQTTPVVSAETALRTMQARFPDSRLRQIRPFGDRVLGALFVQRNAVNPRTHDMVMVDRMTGQMKVFQDGAAVLPGDAAIAWLLPVHSGEIYGPARPVVMTLVGCALLLLTASGLVMWIVKPRRRLKR